MLAVDREDGFVDYPVSWAGTHALLAWTSDSRSRGVEIFLRR